MNKRIAILALMLMLGFPGVSLSQRNSLVPAEFDVPIVLENQYFRIRMLTINDVIKDYDAVMSSVDHLQGVFGPGITWPIGLTLEEDLIDLGWHQKEFQRRTSFAYTVVSLDEERIIGCLYINPTMKGNYDSDITMWVREDVVVDGYDALLFNTVKNWIEGDWPFEKPAYPGREISWADWELLE